MLLNYLKLALRNIAKNRLASFVSISGLVIGITCFLVIYIWIQFHLSFDSYNQKSENIYRIIYKQEYDGQYIKSAVSPAPLGPSLLNEFPGVVNYTRFSNFFGEVLLSYNEKKFYEKEGAYADPGYIDMFSIKMIKGDKSNALEEPYSIVLTESLAKKYFGNDDPMGKIIYLEGFAQLKVTGVIKDISHNSHLTFDFLVPYILMKQWGSDLDDWNNWGHQYTYIELNNSTTEVEFNKLIKSYLDKFNPLIKGELYLQNIRDIHLNTSINYDNYSNLQPLVFVTIFIVVGIVVLFIACLNFINLSTAQSLTRIKEASIRKILGGNKLNLISQYIIESFLISFLAVHLSLIIIELLRTKIEVLTSNSLTLNYYDPKTLIVLFAILVVTGIISGLFPAIFLSVQNPINVLNNKTPKPKGLFSIRRLIVILQFILASSLVVISIYSYQQIKYIKNKDLGFNPSNILAVQLRGDMTGKYITVKNELLSSNLIKHVSYGSSLLTINSNTSDNLNWKGKHISESFEIFSSSVDFDFLEMFDIEIIEGRSFSQEFPSDENSAFIINETAAKKLGFDNPLGEKIEFLGREGIIIGLAKDFHYTSFYQKIEPLIISIRKDWRYYIFIELNTNSLDAKKFIESKWNDLNPEFPLNYIYISDVFESSYNDFQSTSRLILNFTIVSILIAIIGLNALTSYITKSRIKEIGIRKVLGATTGSIVILLNWDFIKIILLSYILSVPLSYLVLSRWMNMFVYRQPITFSIFIYTGIIILLLSIIIISMQVISVSFKNPVESLRYE
jgi:putative ABC transport system permease protein